MTIACGLKTSRGVIGLIQTEAVTRWTFANRRSAFQKLGNLAQTARGAITRVSTGPLERRRLAGIAAVRVGKMLVLQLVPLAYLISDTHTGYREKRR